MRIIAAIPACGLMAGCAFGLSRPDVPFAVVASVLTFSLFISVAGVHFARPLALTGGIAVGCTACGAVLAQQAWRDSWRSPLRLAFESMARDERQAALSRDIVVPLDDRASVVLLGTLRDDASLTDAGTVSLRVSVAWMGRALTSARDPAANPVSGDVTLSVAGELAAARMNAWRRGRVVRVLAQLRRPSRYLDPGVPDQERSLARRGVSLVGSVKSGALVEVVRRGGPIAETAADIRAFSRRAIAASVGRWSSRAAAIVTAIVIGDRTGLGADVERRLQEAGTYHVIAISGGNIAILAGLALFGFRVAGLLGRWAMVSAIAGLLAYGAIVSGGASVDRATLMAVVYFAGRALDLRGPPMNALALVAGGLLAKNPMSIADPGFLLTFGASAAIIAVGQLPALSRRPWLHAALGLGLASLAAEAALFPVSAAFFSRATLAGLALNFVAIPAMVVTQIAGMLAVPLWGVNTQTASFVGRVAAAGAETLVRSASLVDLFPQVTWRLPVPSGTAIAVYYGALIAWWVLRAPGAPDTARTRRARLATGTVAAAAALWILVAPWSCRVSRGDGRLHVTFLDVGQGDAVLVQFPRGDTMLIDTGGSPAASSFDVGDRVVGQVLRTLGVRRLDTVVVTHADLDHVGGGMAVVGEFRPRDVWEGIPVPPSLELQALAEKARSVGARWTRVQRGDEMFIDDVRVVVRHPMPADWERQDVRNDDSIVIELQWGSVSIVATGDVGEEVERLLASSFEPVPLRVLKVPHHGSRTSSSETFLRALRPDVAVISVGRSNTFGHPAPAVLKRYEALATAVYRTDRDGAITLSTDGDTIDVTTFMGQEARIARPFSSHEDAKRTKP